MRQVGKMSYYRGLKHQHAFPTIARVVAIYLAIPPTSAAPERVFSLAENTVTKKRNLLGADRVDGPFSIYFFGQSGSSFHFEFLIILLLAC